jgi:hypothetical protein
MIFHWQLVEMPVISFTCEAVCHCFSMASSEPNRSQMTRHCSSIDLCTLLMIIG